MIAYWLTSIVDDLRTHLSLSELDCDVMPEPNPKPNCGVLFVGVLGASVSNPEPNAAGPLLRESYSFTIAVSRKFEATPRHRSRRIYLEEATSILTVAMKIKLRLHGNYDLNAAATTLLDASDFGGGYTGRLTFVSNPANPESVGTDWWMADMDEKSDANRGLYIPITFDGIRYHGPLS